jgi:antitoxin (DNA-binding transcriptional repressor) of toxin-antitoxin stability system
MLSRAGSSLFVVLLILVIVAMIALVLQPLGRNCYGPGYKKAKTQTILAAMRKGIELTLANRGGPVAPIAEHPFAGSQAPRWSFVRAADGSEVASEGEALFADPQRIDEAARARTLAADDVYADPRLPFLFGLPRSRIGLLNAVNPRVSGARRLPAGDGALPSPYDDGRYPGSAWPAGGLPSTDHQEASRAALQRWFSGNSALEELAGLGAIVGDASPLRPRIDQPVGSQPVAGVAMPLAWVAADADCSPHWVPGCVYLPLTGATAPRWRRYRLSGTAIYDAWGNEVLTTVAANGDLRIESAGTDGVFRWDPGKDHRLQTAARADQPAGDDRDGSRDNIFAGVR